jgi:glycosyltransferase involved in cell wall biosynthesis
MSLSRVDSRRIFKRAGACSAFMVVRDEALRLPHLLDYHRALGVDRFYVVDNGSTDGTLELVLDQPDCHVFRTDDAFGAASFGMDWVNALVEEYGTGSWCLFIDADELLVYPHSETVRLPEFCAFLDRVGAEGVWAMMLDMYNQGPLRDARYEAGRPFLATCPHFDPDYVIRPSVGDTRGEIVGGPRLRVFYPELAGAGPLRTVLRRGLRSLRMHRVGKLLGLAHTRIGAGLPPELRKVPLIKARPGLRWIGNHSTTPLAVAPVSAVLLHFKFFADFHERVVREAARGQHWDGAAEYARYADMIASNADAAFFTSRSETFRSSAQLVDLGLMRSVPELDELAMRWNQPRRERQRSSAPASEGVAW